jgi:hypothetical protein
MKIGRNDPGPCGSGKKYKKCHLASDEQAAAEARASRPGASAGSAGRTVQRGDERFLVSDGVSDDALDLARKYFEQRDTGQGPADQLMAFAAPLLDATDGSTDEVDKATAVASALWNLALLPKEQRETSLLATAQSLGGASDEARSEFLGLARLMIERHEDMFPELHASE